MSHSISDAAASGASPASSQTACRLSDVNNTFSVIVQEGDTDPRPKQQSPNDKWTLLQKKRLKNRLMGCTGNARADSENNFKVANIHVYIYNVSKETTVTDISSYVFKKTNLALKLDKMNMKIYKDYDGYIAYIPRQKMDIFLKHDFWPAGVKYRRFVNFPRNTEKKTFNGVIGNNSSVNG